MSKEINSTTQQFLDIFDISNNMVIMKDGTTSLILSVDAMNFGLLAEEEQDSIMYAYAGLLNSLNYPIQILIRSQTKDVTGYLRLLKEQEDGSPSRNKQKRIQRYREFVSNLIRERNVLDKKFYIVIPAEPIELGVLPASSILPGKGSINITSVDRNLILEKARNILEPKRDHLIAQFARIGLYSRQLETQEVIQLFYLSYNPEASEGQTIGNSGSYSVPLVTAKIESNLMGNDLPINYAPDPIQNHPDKSLTAKEQHLEQVPQPPQQSLEKQEVFDGSGASQQQQQQQQQPTSGLAKTRLINQQPTTVINPGGETQATNNMPPVAEI